MADGTPVDLFINDSMAAATATEGGRAKLEDVDFPSVPVITIEVEIGPCTSEGNESYGISGTLEV